MSALPTTREALAACLEDARARTLALVEDLSDDALAVPRLPIVNPLLWELGHVAWFQERWILRHAAGLEPLRPGGDALYDSSAVAHETRWELPLPGREGTLAYLEAVLERVLERLEAAALEKGDLYFHHLALLHEDMHGEALLMTRQTLGYPEPPGAAREPEPAGPLPGDVEVPGCAFELGSRRSELFVFDNEKWSHPLELAPFRIARAPVTQGELAGFVEEGGFRRRELWSEEGWAWRERAGASHPLCWRPDGQRDGPGRWLRRHFDRFVPLEEHRPALCVNAHEAEAFARFAGRRLPTEAEWELAASSPGAFAEAADERERRYPWGHEPPASSGSPGLAHLDLRSCHHADVAAYPSGDSALGCRQLLGNVWEWTASPFTPYPGFEPDPYHDYSLPWFGTHRVLRGGSFATRSRLAKSTFRNFYTPDRRDPFAGFRTAADA